MLSRTYVHAPTHVIERALLRQPDQREPTNFLRHYHCQRSGVKPHWKNHGACRPWRAVFKSAAAQYSTSPADETTFIGQTEIIQKLIHIRNGTVHGTDLNYFWGVRDGGGSIYILVRASQRVQGFSIVISLHHRGSIVNQCQQRASLVQRLEHFSRPSTTVD